MGAAKRAGPVPQLTLLFCLRSTEPGSTQAKGGSPTDFCQLLLPFCFSTFQTPTLTSLLLFLYSNTLTLVNKKVLDEKGVGQKKTQVFQGWQK